MSADHTIQAARHPFRRPSPDYGHNPGQRLNGNAYNMADTAESFKDTNGAPLSRLETIGSIQLTPEQFERMYLGPYNEVKGDLRKTFGNPTPIGLGGFLLAFTPLVCQFLGWRSASDLTFATIGATYFLGGMLAILASIGEFILGNSFPSTFFGVYGGFFFAYGATLTPSFAAFKFYSTTNDPLEGAMEPGFLASIAFLAAFTGVFTFILTIAALRTNLMFFLAFLSLFLAFMFFTASRFYGAQGNLVLYAQYEYYAGCVGFATAMIGWYLLTVEVLTTVDFPVNLPVFDLSKYIPGATELEKKKRKNKAAGDLEAEKNA